MTQLTDLFNPSHIFKLGETMEETQITAPSSDDDRFMSSDESEIESDEEEREKRYTVFVTPQNSYPPLGVWVWVEGEKSHMEGNTHGNVH